MYSLKDIVRINDILSGYHGVKCAVVNLKEQGYRFCVSPDKVRCRWMHPVEYKAHFSHWIDHTDTPEKEFIEFLSKNAESSVDVPTECL